MLLQISKQKFCCNSLGICKYLVSFYSTAGPNPPQSPQTPVLAKNEGSLKVEKSKEVTKENLQWRTPWHEKEGKRYSFLRAMYSDEDNVNVLKFVQSPINLTPSAIKKWWLKKKEREEIFLQQYLPERNQILGNELAAAHFIVFRGGAVKFFDEDKWIKADDNGNYSLPVRYDSEKILEAIDCEYMNLHYEGLVNFRNLQRLEWLSLNGSKYIDDWCLDRIANIFSSTLVYLDIRNCPEITERGLGALYKITSLKILLLDDLLRHSRYEMTCLLLQDLNPSLDIRSE